MDNKNYFGVQRFKEAYHVASLLMFFHKAAATPNAAAMMQTKAHLLVVPLDVLEQTKEALINILGPGPSWRTFHPILMSKRMK